VIDALQLQDDAVQQSEAKRGASSVHKQTTNEADNDQSYD